MFTSDPLFSVRICDLIPKTISEHVEMSDIDDSELEIFVEELRA